MSSCGSIVILGGGVQGLTLAWFLAREGCKVRLIDRQACGREASWAGAGIIPPGLAKANAPVTDRLRSLSSGLFAKMSEDLLSLTGIDNGYRICGSWHLSDDQGSLDHVVEVCKTESLAYEVLSESYVRRRLDWLGPNVNAACYVAQTAQVRNPWHLKALEAACRQSGVVISDNLTVGKLIIDGIRVSSVETSEGMVFGDEFVLAAGAWSCGLAASINIVLPVRPVRGVIVLLDCQDTCVSSIVEQGKRYIVPRGDGLFLVGSNEVEAGFDKTVDPHTVDALEAWAQGIVPKLANARRVTSWAGLRPGSPDGAPFLGRCPGIKNLYLATGHHRSGLQLSPGSATLIADIIMGRNTVLPVEPFSPLRPEGRLSRGFNN
jgi:glycine oxidase